MRAPKNELPLSLQEGAAFSRDIEWGDMNVSYESFPRGMDLTPFFKGLPDDRCQCPHWGYLFKGKMRVNYPDRDEEVNSGEVYYMAPGHLAMFEEDCELVEFSPKAELKKTMDVLSRNMEELKGSR
jgi:hypothetical protein